MSTHTENIQELKIAIFGAGAMGTTLGAFLTKGGLKNVHLVARNQTHVNALKQKGATVICKADDTRFTIPVTALFPDEMQGKYDVIFLMTKQRENAKILTGLLPFLHENSVVCTTQNGLPELFVAEIVGTKRTYGAVTSFGANFLGEGEVKLTSKLSAMHMEVGGYENDGEKTAMLAEILSYAGKGVTNDDFVTATDNLAGARWTKLSINAAFSSLSTMTGLTFGQVAKKRGTRKLALAMLRECVAVAKAKGVQLAKIQGKDVEKLFGENTWRKRFIAYLILPFAMRKHKNLHSGMLFDIQSGKKCEIDFVAGIIGKEGKKLGLETPVCDQVVDIVHGIENGLYEIDYKNVDFFEI